MFKIMRMNSTFINASSKLNLLNFKNLFIFIYLRIFSKLKLPAEVKDKYQLYFPSLQSVRITYKNDSKRKIGKYSLLNKNFI